MEFNQVSPPSPPTDRRRSISVFTAILLTIGFEVTAAAALAVAFGTSLCSLFGAECTAAGVGAVYFDTILNP
jgi:hypothetical protein